MKRPMSWAVLAIAAGAAAPASASQPTTGIRVDPVRVAPVRVEHGKIVPDGPWISYPLADPRARTLPVPAFDCLGVAGGLGPFEPGIQFCPSECDVGLQIKVLHPCPNTVEDMQSIRAAPGGILSALGTAWYWGPPAPAPLVMAYVFYEEVYEGCTDPLLFTPTGTGIMIDFGSLPPSGSSFYYSFVLNLEMLNMKFPSTDDDHDGYPDGSYQMLLATEITASGPVFPAFPAYPLVGATGDATDQCRVGHNNAQAWDDDTPNDGLFDATECYEYTNPSCPFVTGKANAFFFRRCRADLNADGFVDGIDMDLFNNAFETGGCDGEFNGDCFLDGIDADRFYNEFETACP